MLVYVIVSFSLLLRVACLKVTLSGGKSSSSSTGVNFSVKMSYVPFARDVYEKPTPRGWSMKSMFVSVFQECSFKVVELPSGLK